MSERICCQKNDGEKTYRVFWKETNTVSCTVDAWCEAEAISKVKAGDHYDDVDTIKYGDPHADSYICCVTADAE